MSSQFHSILTDQYRTIMATVSPVQTLNSSSTGEEFRVWITLCGIKKKIKKSFSRSLWPEIVIGENRLFVDFSMVSCNYVEL